MEFEDFGGTGPPVVLLHGLAGYAGEWADTAAWLTAHRGATGPRAGRSSSSSQLCLNQ